VFAYGMALWSSWAELSTDEVESRVWDRIAYATRYGHITLSEAFSLDSPDLIRFNRALNKIVEQENTPPKR
jgi:hypothetical protein